MNDHVSGNPAGPPAMVPQGGSNPPAGGDISFASPANRMRWLRPHPSSQFASQIAGRSSGLMTWLTKHLHFDLLSHHPDRLLMWKPSDTFSGAVEWAEGILLPLYGFFDQVRSRFEKNPRPEETSAPFSWARPPETLGGRYLSLAERLHTDLLSPTSDTDGISSYDANTEGESDTIQDIVPATDQATGDTDASATSPPDTEDRLHSRVFPPILLKVENMLGNLRRHLGVAGPGPANQGVGPVRPTIIDQAGHRPQLGQAIGEPSIPAAHHLGVQTVDSAVSPREGPSVVATSQTETNVPVPRPILAERPLTPAERSLAGPGEMRPELPVPRPIPAERPLTPAERSLAGPGEVRPELPVPRPIPAERPLAPAERSLAGPGEVRPELPVPRPIPAERPLTPAERSLAGPVEPKTKLPVYSPLLTEDISASQETITVHHTPDQEPPPEGGATQSVLPLPHLVHTHPAALRTKSLFMQDHPHDDEPEKAIDQPFPSMAHLSMREPRGFATESSELSRRVFARLTSDVTSSRAGDFSEERVQRPIGVSRGLPELAAPPDGSQLTGLEGHAQAEYQVGGRQASAHPVARMLQQTTRLYPFKDEVDHESLGSESADWERDAHLFESLTYSHDQASAPGGRPPEARLPLAVGGFLKRSEEGAPVIATAPLDRSNAANINTASASSETRNHVQSDQSSMGQVDLDSMAREVYQIIKRRMCVEKERCASGS